MFKVGDTIKTYTVTAVINGFGGQTLRLRCKCGAERCVTITRSQAVVAACECQTRDAPSQKRRATRAADQEYKPGERHGKLTLVRLVNNPAAGYKPSTLRGIWRCDCGAEACYACSYVRFRMGADACCPECRTKARRARLRSAFESRVSRVAEESRKRVSRGKGAKPLTTVSVVTADMRDGGLSLTTRRIIALWDEMPKGKACPAWQEDYKAFVDWSLRHGYARGKVLVRLDKRKRYHPANCKWVTE